MRGILRGTEQIEARGSALSSVLSSSAFACFCRSALDIQPSASSRYLILVRQLLDRLRPRLRPRPRPLLLLLGFYYLTRTAAALVGPGLVLGEHLSITTPSRPSARHTRLVSSAIHIGRPIVPKDLAVRQTLSRARKYCG